MGAITSGYTFSGPSTCTWDMSESNQSAWFFQWLNVLVYEPWPLNFTQILAEPFKCGATITGNIRTVFRYERQNMTEEDTTGMNLTDPNNNSTEYRPDAVNLTSLPDSSGHSRIVPVFEEIIAPQMAGMTRIVNGEDCPPGECPWQVETPLNWKKHSYWIMTIFFVLQMSFLGHTRESITVQVSIIVSTWTLEEDIWK